MSMLLLLVLGMTLAAGGREVAAARTLLQTYPVCGKDSPLPSLCPLIVRMPCELWSGVDAARAGACLAAGKEVCFESHVNIN